MSWLHHYSLYHSIFSVFDIFRNEKASEIRSDNQVSSFKKLKVFRNTRCLQLEINECEKYFPNDGNFISTKLASQTLGNVKYHVGYSEPGNVKL